MMLSYVILESAARDKVRAIMHEFKTRVNASLIVKNKKKKGGKIIRQAFVKQGQRLFKATRCRWFAKSRFHDFDLGNETRAATDLSTRVTTYHGKKHK